MSTIRPFDPIGVDEREGLPQDGFRATWDAKEMFRDTGLQLITGNRASVDANFLSVAASLDEIINAVIAGLSAPVAGVGTTMTAALGTPILTATSALSRISDTWIFEALSATTYQITQQNTGTIVGPLTTSGTPNTTAIPGVSFTVATTPALVTGSTSSFFTNQPGSVFQSPSYKDMLLFTRDQAVAAFNQVTAPVSASPNATMFTALNSTPPSPTGPTRFDDSWTFTALTSTTYRIIRGSTGLATTVAVSAATTAKVQESVDSSMFTALGSISVTSSPTQIGTWRFVALSATTYQIVRVESGVVTGPLTTSGTPNTTAIPGVTFTVATTPALVAGSQASFQTNPAVSATPDAGAIPGVSFIVATTPTLVPGSVATFNTTSSAQDYQAGLFAAAVGGMLE